MKVIFGVLFVAGCVFGGFLISGGQLLALWHPPELLIILGGATGAFIISNPPKVIGASAKGFLSILKGNKYNKSIYMELLTLMHDLFAKARKEGLMSLEADIDEPKESELFKKFPKISSNHHLMDFICDYLRLMVGGNMNAFELESLMDVELDTHHHESAAPATAVTNMSDGLPG
ncbi:MAG: flagellar motor stator protein MotA, partial [Thioalkalispiraceae bacterium]